jgi:hypothetical protein
MTDTDTPTDERQKPPKPKERKRRGRPRGSKTKLEATSVSRLGLRVSEFMRTYGVSRSAVYGAIRHGVVETAKLGKIRIVFPIKR